MVYYNCKEIICVTGPHRVVDHETFFGRRFRPSDEIVVFVEFFYVYYIYSSVLEVTLWTKVDMFVGTCMLLHKVSFRIIHNLGEKNI